MTYFNKYHDLKVKYVVKKEDGIVIAQFETPKDEETILCLKDFTQKYFKTSILEEIEDVAYIPGYRFTDLEVRIDNLVGIAYLNKEHDTFDVRFGKYLAKEKLYRKLWTRASNQYLRRINLFTKATISMLKAYTNLTNICTDAEKSVKRLQNSSVKDIVKD